MNAAKKIILLLWLLLASLGNVSASTPGAPENRVWEKSFAALETRQAEPSQTAGGHQENGVAGYGYAVDCLLAADSAASVIASRQALAHQFYKNGGFTDEQIASHMSGIDFSQPVQITTLPSGTQVVQYQIPGARMGNYFAPPGTPANTLGIYTSGLNATTYTITQPTTVLQSTAASTIDTWSMKGAGWNVQAQGGGTQFFMPLRPGLKPTP